MSKLTENEQKKENRRVRYTRMALRESLLALLQQNPINKITVSRVCEQADVNRSTFYLYFKDVYDLLDQIEMELYVQIENAVQKADDLLGDVETLRRIYEIIYKNRDLCSVLFGQYGDKAFLKKVGSIQRERMIADWSSLAPGLSLNMLEHLHAFSAYTNIGIMEKWILGDFQETPEQLAHFVSRLLKNGLLAYLPRK